MVWLSAPVVWACSSSALAAVRAAIAVRVAVGGSGRGRARHTEVVFFVGTATSYDVFMMVVSSV